MLRTVARQKPILILRRSLRSQAKPTSHSFIKDARQLVKSKKVKLLEAENSIAGTKQIVKKSQKTYFDPSNKTLDFSLPNEELLSKIQKGSRDRTIKRVQLPSDEWASSHGARISQIYKKMQQHLVYGRVSLADNLSPLSVGDLVLLGNQSTLLHIVVACPQALDSDTYTFVDNEGEVTYGSKHHIKLRIPKVIPKSFLDSLDLVCLEKKYLGVAPVGMPDSKFSRSTLSLPETLQKNQQGNQQEVNSGADFSNSGDDFIVAQATSQLLTDTDVKTYIVPTSARRVFSDFLTNASIVSFSKVTAFMNKLEYFHKVLQYDANNNLIDGSRTISLFELLGYISNFDETLKLMLHVKGEPDEYKIINSFIRGSKLDSKTTFGRDIPQNTSDDFAHSSHSITSYIAYIVALSRSGRMWKLNVQKSTKTPISVEILPALRSLSMENTLDYLKGDGSKDFIKFYLDFMKSGDSTDKPPHYEAIIQMFKDLTMSNVSSDRTMESVMGSLIRNIDKALEKEGLHIKGSIPHAYEYSKSRAFEIVMSLDRKGYTNPVRWSDSLKFPNSSTSPESDMFSQYYSFLDSKFGSKSELMEVLQSRASHSAEIDETDAETDQKQWLKNEFHSADTMQDVREDFGDIPIYCIDSATAHEIDDGISLHVKGEKYVFTIHVANPTSYIKQNSTLSEIAFSKGTTVYLPEGPSMMLPQLISKMCGLNGDGETRTLAIQFDLERADIDQFLTSTDIDNGPKSSLAKKVLKQIDLTARIKFYNARNFPQNFTYENVNKILNDKDTIAKFRSGQLAEGSHELNLFKLFHVSSILKHIRIAVGNGMEISSEKSKVSVEYTLAEVPENQQFERVPNGYRLTLPKGKDTEATPIITITEDVDQNGESKSQQLVSNFMIAANYAGLTFAHLNNIPIVHRTQELSLEKSVRQEVQRLNQSLYDGKKAPTVEQKAQILSILTAANYEVSRKRHETLGLSSYLNLTSPLRRYVDMVNHWMFESHARKGSSLNPPDHTSQSFSKGDLEYVASHLQSCEFITKSSQRFAERFWKGTFLKQYFERLNRGEIRDPIQFSILLRSDAKFGDIRVEIQGFGELKTTIVQNDTVVNKFAKGELQVGQVLKDAQFRVVRLDFLEDDLAIELV